MVNRIMCASSVKRLRRRLWRSLNVAWRKNSLADDWLVAEGCCFPKEENSTYISQFGTLSLLNAEGNILLGILAERLTNFMFDNKYTDTSVQKRGIPVIPGCLEHTSIMSKMIEDAKRNQSDLTVLWLDLTNTYGTIPRKLEELTLKSYHVLSLKSTGSSNCCVPCMTSYCTNSIKPHTSVAESPNCTLCRRPDNLEHVLYSCRTSLADGKFQCN